VLLCGLSARPGQASTLRNRALHERKSSMCRIRWGYGQDRSFGHQLHLIGTFRPSVRLRTTAYVGASLVMILRSISSWISCRRRWQWRHHLGQNAVGSSASNGSRVERCQVLREIDGPNITVSRPRSTRRSALSTGGAGARTTSRHAQPRDAGRHRRRLQLIKRGKAFALGIPLGKAARSAACSASAGTPSTPCAHRTDALAGGRSRLL